MTEARFVFLYLIIITADTQTFADSCAWATLSTSLATGLLRETLSLLLWG